MSTSRDIRHTDVSRNRWWLVPAPFIDVIPVGRQPVAALSSGPRPEDRYQEPSDLVTELERIAKFQNLAT